MRPYFTPYGLQFPWNEVTLFDGSHARSAANPITRAYEVARKLTFD